MGLISNILSPLTYAFQSAFTNINYMNFPIQKDGMNRNGRIYSRDTIEEAINAFNDSKDNVDYPRVSREVYKLMKDSKNSIQKFNESKNNGNLAIFKNDNIVIDYIPYIEDYYKEADVDHPKVYSIIEEYDDILSSYKETLSNN